MRGANERTTPTSRRLRVNQTDAEAKLWQSLRARQLFGLKFARQQPIGRYICDFVCREKLSVVEVDGGQHADSKEDEVRDRYLREKGYRVLRFWNNDVLSNLDGVLEVIAAELGETPAPFDRPVPPHPDR
jgi:very-short-patch-repair endonuclease